MSNNSGWIKLHRSILHDPRYLTGKFSKGQAWIDMMLLANREDGEFTTDRGILVKVRRGQLAWSQKNLAARWGWAENTVAAHILRLKSLGHIEVQTSRATTVITILCYNETQKVDAHIKARVDAHIEDKQEDKEDKEYFVHSGKSRTFPYELPESEWPF